ncbi:TRAF-like family protein [Citrus sinensis]|uniref:TRAF-like family protein n=1 Tax=Citrus sinensis TaxID=2711 RepID=A0ACB8KGG3_CITSI|nr:TRAF-like family protein [Citrus sinensis]
MENDFADQVAISRSISNVPPAHFLLKIETFSSLVENNVENCESLEFDAGGYKWKLVVYPNGNKNKNVKDHISLYLAMVDTSSLGLGWEVYVIFRLFVLDQNKDEFLILQDAMGKERRFHVLKLEWGFDQFIPLEEFNDASNGYLVGDTCVFGAEVLVKERNKCKGECLFLAKLTSASNYKHVWKIENFSKLEAKLYESEVFVAGNQKWKIKLYPKGQGVGRGSHISVYLALADLSTITRDSKIYVHFTLRIRDQVLSKHNEKKASTWLSTSSEDWGWSTFVELSYFNKAENGFLMNDVCIVEAEQEHGSGPQLKIRIGQDFLNSVT